MLGVKGPPFIEPITVSSKGGKKGKKRNNPFFLVTDFFPGRKYACDVLEETTNEMLILGTFKTLKLTMDREKGQKNYLHNLVLRLETEI